jgi:hypothetical protein
MTIKERRNMDVVQRGIENRREERERGRGKGERRQRRGRGKEEWNAPMGERGEEGKRKKDEAAAAGENLRQN